MIEAIDRNDVTKVGRSTGGGEVARERGHPEGLPRRVSPGLSIATGSASGLWLVTPAASLAAAALVYGFERQDLARRFGGDALHPPLLSLPRGRRLYI